MAMRLRVLGLSVLIATCGVGAPTAVIADSLDATEQETEIQEFRFELKGCTLGGKKIACQLLVTSRNRDKDLKIARGSRMFDDSGNEYQVSSMEIANKNASGRNLSSLFVSGIPTPVRLHFHNVSSQSRTVALLQMNCGGPSGSFTVEFRDIPLRK